MKVDKYWLLVTVPADSPKGFQTFAAAMLTNPNEVMLQEAQAYPRLKLYEMGRPPGWFIERVEAHFERPEGEEQLPDGVEVAIEIEERVTFWDERTEAGLEPPVAEGTDAIDEMRLRFITALLAAKEAKSAISTVAAEPAVQTPAKVGPVSPSGEDVVATNLAVIFVPQEAVGSIEALRSQLREATLAPGYQIHRLMLEGGYQVRIQAASMEAVRSHAEDVKKLIPQATYQLLGPADTE